MRGTGAFLFPTKETLNVRFYVRLLAASVAVWLLLPAAASATPEDNLVRNAWTELGHQIEAGADYAAAVEQARIAESYAGGRMACPLPTSTFVDSWGAPRSGGRSHLGVDMMAPHGVPVLAPATGTYRQHGYESFYLDAVDGTRYFGTHVAGHLHPDGPVAAGTPVAVNSNTGNAAGGAPHLHLQIAPTGGENWINPFPATQAACAEPMAAPVALRTAETRLGPAMAIRFCRFTTGGMRAPFFACVHLNHGHEQGTPGHRWADFQRQARQLARYLHAVSRPTCSGPSDCPSLILTAFQRQGVAHQGATAVRVSACESGHNPRAYNGSSGASGLFQQLARYWPGRAAQYGFAGASAFDPWANAMVSAGMVRDTGGWSHWVCRG